MMETQSISQLLKENNSKLSAVKANKILLGLNILEEKERQSKANPDKTKKYKVFTPQGERFGINKKNINNPDETAPYYYVEAFSELLVLIESAL